MRKTIYEKDLYKQMKIIATIAQLSIKNPKKYGTPKNKLPLTVKLRDSIANDVKGQKLTAEKKIVVKHFSGVKTKDMKSYIIPILKQNPETIIAHKYLYEVRYLSRRNYTKGYLSTSCKTQANKVNLSSIVPRHNKLNEKAIWVNKYLKEESEVCFIDYRNISPKHNCNRSCYI